MEIAARHRQLDAVAPNATAGAPLVTGSAAILGTCLVAAAGDWPGLTEPGDAGTAGW